MVTFPKLAKKYFDERAISLAYAQRAGARFADPELAAHMGFPFARQSQGGIVWPYLHPLTREPHSTLMRIRYLGELPRNADGKEVKCVQPIGSGVEAFFDCGVDWLEVLSHQTIPIAFTEGEGKTICLNEHRGKDYNTVTVGLGGIWNFREKGTGDLTPWLRLVRTASQDREMIIAFDSDMAEKQDIQRAAATFAALMQMKVRGVWCI